MHETAKLNGSKGEGILYLYTHHHKGQRFTSHFRFENQGQALAVSNHEGFLIYEGLAFTDNDDIAKRVEATVSINPIDDHGLHYEILFNDKHFKFIN